MRGTAIKQDAADPDFQQMLKALGTLRLRDSAQTKNTEQMVGDLSGWGRGVLLVRVCQEAFF